jgi:hypothetical protein
MVGVGEGVGEGVGVTVNVGVGVGVTVGVGVGVPLKAARLTIWLHSPKTGVFNVSQFRITFSVVASEPFTEYFNGSPYLLSGPHTSIDPY